MKQILRPKLVMIVGIVGWFFLYLHFIQDDIKFLSNEFEMWYNHTISNHENIFDGQMPSTSL